jgi:hypothetical protein
MASTSKRPTTRAKRKSRPKRVPAADRQTLPVRRVRSQAACRAELQGRHQGCRPVIDHGIETGGV